MNGADAVAAVVVTVYVATVHLHNNSLVLHRSNTCGLLTEWYRDLGGNGEIGGSGCGGYEQHCFRAGDAVQSGKITDI